ncbi:ABC transporter permease [Paenibacillus sp. 7124]|uniref:ABC transporter permease n=2 Tax=Paenibacillus apii TaxID=1850370 RepID=A0A6M1PIR7_9BACL|nr:ABC transporter permease [Paenibacillus apii]NJJ39581.1 ABC transporter permease [Paenibacillus apii]
METLVESVQYIFAHTDTFLTAVKIHLTLSVTAMLIGIILCVPLGIYLAKSNKGSVFLLNLINMGRVIPSLAVLAFVMPYLGIGFVPSLFALTMLVCPPILINTVAALKELDKSIIEAAHGIGMDQRRVLYKVELPLALPVIITGIRTSFVDVIAGASIAAFIGGGGLGEFIINGLVLMKPSLLFVGAIPIALLALLVDMLMGRLQKWVSPPGV